MEEIKIIRKIKGINLSLTQVLKPGVIFRIKILSKYKNFMFMFVWNGFQTNASTYIVNLTTGELYAPTPSDMRNVDIEIIKE